MSLLIWFAVLVMATPAIAHDIYTGKRDASGMLCCGGQECGPVEAVPLNDGKYYLPASGEILPASMAQPSPDERFHRCTHPINRQWGRKPDSLTGWGYIVVPNNTTLDGSPRTRCFFAPYVGY